MFDRIMRLYKAGNLTKEGVWNAVVKGWITEDQYVLIVEET